MKKGMKRVIAFIMAVLMVLTMADWGGLAVVAKADTTTTRVYFQKPTDWSSVTLYTWDDYGNATYTMNAMSASSDTSIYWYYCDVTGYSGNFNMIFQYNNWAAQTVDVTGVSAGGTYAYQPNGTSGSKINVIAGDTVRVYYNNPNNWSNVKIHFWANASYGPVSVWNTMAMTSTGNGWYYFDVPVVATDSEDGFNVIFTDGTNQTDTISVSTGNSSEAYTVKGTAVTSYGSISAAESAIGTSSGGNSGSGSTGTADFTTSSSGNMVYCYAPSYTGETLTLKYQANNSNDNQTATATAIEGCPGWYVAEIQSTLWFVELQCDGYPKFGKDFNSGTSQYFSPITSTSGSLLILSAVGSAYNTYTNGTTAVNSLGLTVGYPGNPYPDTMDVWYYNPNWTTAADVTMYYKSSLVALKGVTAKSFGSAMPGWFYVDGSANGIYINNSDNTIEQISFAGADGLTSTQTWSGSDAVVAAATSVLYLSETGTAYATVEELVAAENPAVSPLSDTTITLYSSENLAGATVTAEVDGQTVTGTVAAGTEASQYVVTLDFNAAVNNAACAISKGSINVSVNATGINMFVNMDTGVSYDSWAALQDGLTSTLTFTNATAALTDVKVSVVQMDYTTGIATTKDVTLNLTAGEGNTYTATVPTDAAKLGYTLSYLYDGKTHISRISEKNATIDLNNISENLVAYFYTGIDGDGVDAEFKTGWTSVYADIFYYPAGSSEKAYIDGWKECTYVGNGWWCVDTGVSATNEAYENGIFIKFKNGYNADDSTKAFQFLNNYRVFATSQMNMFKSAEKALQVLRETEQELPEDNTGATTVWFYHPGGWNSYNMYASDGTSTTYSTIPMTREEALTNNAGGYWYHAAVPSGTKTIYFSDSTGANKTVVYDISSNTASEIFCADSTAVISTGWSTSPAGIAKHYDLVNNPSTNEISLPITILDYNKDDLFFEYDANILRAMTFVLANKDVVANLGINTDVFIDEAYAIDGNGNANNRPGNVPYFDRNGIEYVTGILETELVNGNPVYTEKAITYVAKIVQAYCNINDIEQGKTAVFQNLQKQNWSKTYTDAQWAAEYDAAVAKYSAMSAETFASYNVATDSDLSVMDYVYYVMNNFYNTNSAFNKDFNMYSYLVLKKTSPNVYGFYANYSTDKTADYLDQNYGVVYAPKADGSGKIYNSDSGDKTRGGFFPYDGDFIYNTLGQTATDSAEYINTHNYHYTMRASGKFLFEDAKDLYFTFTGDDDVVLYINGKIALDLSGAHRSASYTVYLSDLNDQGFNLVDGVYYDFDFFYMERHTEYSNLRIETNIDPVDTAGKVQKYAYEDKDGDGIAESRIPSGAFREDGTVVTYEFELTAPSKDGLQNLTFADPSLGITITPESIALGSYTDADGNVVERSISDLEVMVGTATYAKGSLTEETLKTILTNGIQAGERITISGFKHVLNEGIEGTVTAEGDGISASDQHIVTTDSHAINVNKPSITVTKTAADKEGNNLPEGSVLQAGETATYTITLKNSGTSPLMELAIVDEALGFSMNSGEIVLNEYTDPTDLKFTLLGTGAIDGIYQITPSTNADPEVAAQENQAALEALVKKLTQVIYSSNASLSVSGINYPIVGTFPSTAVGTAHYLTNINGNVMREIENYGMAYTEYKQNGGTEPNVSNYVTSVTEDSKAAVDAYVAAYKTYMDTLLTEGYDFYNTDLIYAPDCGFALSNDTVQNEASLTLNAKLSAYNYYSQVGQTIVFGLGESETALQKADTTTTVKVADTEFTAGAHTVSFWNNSDTAVVVSKITLAGGATIDLSVADYANVSVKDANGNTVSGRITDGKATLQAGETLVFDLVEITTAGSYAVSVDYTAAAAATGVLVVDREPGKDYVLTDLEGNALTAENGKYTIGSAEVIVDNSGAYPEITYTASKTGIQVFGVLEAGASEGTLPDTVTVNTFDVADDVYVLDYGLNVNLTDTAWKNGLFQNDQIAASTGDVTNVLGAKAVSTKIDKTTGYVYQYIDATYSGVADGQYGSVTVDGTTASAIVTYSLNSFLEGIDRYAYGVQVGKADVAAEDKNVTNSTPVMEANVTIMPATIVYYEDNFASVITNGTVTEGDSDREQTNSLETQYGYDQAYQNDTAYSNNGYTALSSADKLAFTFQGTGFDILTRTADANLKVSVYDANKFELKAYTYGSGKLGISVVRKTGVDSTETALKTMSINAFYENGILDQIPLISVEMDAYGKYIVLAQKAGTTENLNVDGIRIYNPMEVDSEVSDAYGNAAGENGATIQEIREMIFGKGYSFNYADPEDPSSVTITEGQGAVAGLVQMESDGKLNIATGSTVIELYTDAKNSADIAENRAENPGDTSELLGYAVSGPSNELYLAGESNAFGAVVNGITANSALQIGLKAVNSKDNDTDDAPVTVQYRALDGEWKDITDASALSTSTEMYYKIDIADLWKNDGDSAVLLIRVLNGTVSLTNLKYNGVSFEKLSAGALGGIVVESESVSAFNIISKGTAGSNAVITFTASIEVVDFTITGPNGKVFTYGTEEALPETVTVSMRKTGDLMLYVVKMPNVAGDYTITTSTGSEFGADGQFTIQ